MKTQLVFIVAASAAPLRASSRSRISARTASRNRFEIVSPDGYGVYDMAGNICQRGLDLVSHRYFF